MDGLTRALVYRVLEKHYPGGQDHDQKRHGRRHGKATPVLQRELPGGRSLSLYQGDLLDAPVDAIVNAANEQLAHVGGLAASIVRRGGMEIQDASDAWIQEHGQAGYDKPAVTHAGSLLAEYVIHAVGPRWMKGTMGEEANLKTAYLSALREADRLGVRSVGFPSISTGIFGVPVEIGARAAQAALQEFFDTHPQTALRDVRFTIYDTPTVEAFQSAWGEPAAKHLGPGKHPSGSPQAAHGVRTYHGTTANLAETIRREGLKSPSGWKVFTSTSKVQAVAYALMAEAHRLGSGPGWFDKKKFLGGEIIVVTIDDSAKAGLKQFTDRPNPFLRFPRAQMKYWTSGKEASVAPEHVSKIEVHRVKDVIKHIPSLNRKSPQNWDADDLTPESIIRVRNLKPLRTIKAETETIYFIRFVYEDDETTLAEAVKAAIDVSRVRDWPTIRREYRLTVYAAVVGYLDSGGRVTRWKGLMRRAVVEHFQQAFQAGYAKNGATAIADEDERWLTDRMNKELGFVDNLFTTLKDLQGVVKADSEASARADGYAATLDGIYSEGLLRGAKSKTLRFVGDDGVESCKTCQSFKGKLHTIRWIVNHGMIPAPGNEHFICKGYQCMHFWEDPKTGERWTF